MLSEGTIVIEEFGASLEITSTTEPSKIKTLEFEGLGTLQGAATVDITHLLAWKQAGTMAGTGSTVIEPEAELTTGEGPTMTLSERTLINHGVVTMSGEKTVLLLKSKAHVENAGTMHLNTSAGTSAGVKQEGAESEFINTGTFDRTGGTGAHPEVSVDFDNKGTIDVATGTVAFGRGSTGHTFNLESGSTVEGSVLFWEGAKVTAGSFNSPSGPLELEETTMTIGSGASASVADLVLDALGKVAGAGTLEVTGTLDWATGTSQMLGTGKTILGIGATGTINIGGAETTIKQRKLINDGTITLGEKSHIIEAEGATIENLGTFVANAEREFNESISGEVGTSFVNLGIFRKATVTESGVKLTKIAVPFDNEGLVEELEGHFEFTNIANAISSAGIGDHLSAPQLAECECGDPVNPATGDLKEQQTDITVPGRGPQFSFTRTYNSAVTSAGDLGVGWTSSWSDHLTIETGKATLHEASGSTVAFTEGGGKYTAPSWSQATLEHKGEEGYFLTYPNQTVLKFANKSHTGESESNRRLETETDRNGNAIKVTYMNTNGKIEFVDSAGSKTLRFFYEKEGEEHLTEVKLEGTTHVVKFAYEAGKLSSVTEPGEESPRWRYKYGGSGRMTEMTDGREGHTTNEYDEQGRVKKQTDPAGRVLEFAYKSALDTRMTNATTGAVTNFSFNGSGEPTAITHGFGTAGATTELRAYDNVGDLLTATDGNGHKTTYEYENFNRIKMTDPDSDITKWGYNGTHDVTSVTTPNNETTTIKRDEHGNAEVIERPAPKEETQATHYTYYTTGLLKSVEDPLEHVWKYEYNTNGNRTSETDPEGNKRTWTYDTAGYEKTTVSPRGNVEGAEPAKYTTEIERDGQERPKKVTDPLGHTTKYAYDGNGNLKELTDSNSHTTEYTYTADNELKTTKAPKGNTTETEYDGEGHVIKQTDGNAHATKYKRNILGQVEEIEDPLARKTTKEYDLAGNLTKVKDAKGRTTTYHYDSVNRLTEVSYSEEATHGVKYEYDADGNRTKMEDGTGTSKYTYDKLDRLTESKDGHGDVVKYEYNLSNQPTEITYPNGKVVTRKYDNDERLKEVKDWLEHATSFTYTEDSELKTTTFPNNKDEYAYNEADQQTKTEFKKGAETLAKLTYTRGNNGELEKTVQTGLPGAEETKYTYDTDNRLEKDGATEYEYDNANNPTKTPGSTNTYDAASQLEKGTGVTYTYNEVGDRTKRTPTEGHATTYGYDQAGNLTEVQKEKEGETPAIEDSYAYDGDGMRASQDIGGTTHHLTWDVTENVPPLLSDEIASYVYGPGGGPIEQISGETARYLHHDQQGSTRLITALAGTSEGKCSYGAYGAATCEGAVTSPLGYDGQYTNTDNGLVYLRARVYDPNTAQFLGLDPLARITWEPYGYSSAEPVNEGDPTGLSGIFGSGIGPSVGPDVNWEEAGEAVAGWGDKLTFGATKWVREELGINNVDTCSTGYQAGGVTALVTGVLIPFGGDAEVAAELDQGIAGVVRGYTRHGLAQAIGRDGGRGVAPSAILDAVRSPISATLQDDGVVKYVGGRAVVVVNDAGKVVTTYARNSAGIRGQP